MEWYWIVAQAVVVLGVLAAMFYLGKNGIMTAELMKAIKSVVEAVSTTFDWVAHAIPSSTTREQDKACELLEICVKAAENMWYNGEITKEDRYNTCQGLFNDALMVYGIELPAGYSLVMDSIICAICEAMGHNNKSKAETTESGSVGQNLDI